jgi:hypothetical protein
MYAVCSTPTSVPMASATVDDVPESTTETDEGEVSVYVGNVYRAAVPSP